MQGIVKIAAESAHHFRQSMEHEREKRRHHVNMMNLGAGAISGGLIGASHGGLAGSMVGAGVGTGIGALSAYAQNEQERMNYELARRAVHEEQIARALENRKRRK